MAQDRMALQWVIKTTRTSVVPSTEHRWHQWGEMSAQTLKMLKRYTHRATVCSPCCHWQHIQEYPLPYHQTTEQLRPSDCETPELILWTLSKYSIKWYPGLKASFDTSIKTASGRITLDLIDSDFWNLKKGLDQLREVFLHRTRTVDIGSALGRDQNQKYCIDPWGENA